jgi:hypothetical protein
MSIPRTPKPAKLVIGLLMRDEPLLQTAAAELERCFGPADVISPWFPFDYTEYYKREMGSPLKRCMICFQRLVGQETLPAVKRATNRIETGLAVDGRRRVNIDPGFLTLERFVLATGKNYSHRIYLGQGIFADLTLMFSDGRFVPLDWTYPDYAEAPMRHFLAEVRDRYRVELRRRPEISSGSGEQAKGAALSTDAGEDLR